MKFFIFSDLHGSAHFAKKVVELYRTEKADKIILLGDVYNHGPRNPFPEVYKPMDVAEVLNGLKDELIVIKGNCDSQVDTLISEFDFLENAVLVSGNKTVFLSHGHIYNKTQKPKTRFDCVIYGHFHTGFIERIDGTVFANAGSIALPKDGTPNSYLILEDGKLTLKDLDGKVIAETVL